MSQARAINGNGIFIISTPQKFKPSLDNCISLLLPGDVAEKAAQGDQTDKTDSRTYSLAQLTELQNKLMLIATKAEQGREEVNRFLEILEKIEMVGKLYLQLLSVGNILFIDWKAEVYCDPKRKVTIYAEFGIAGILVQSKKPILEELDGICKIMEHCLVEWKKYLETQRNNYCHLNMFTARQLFYLCSKLAKLHEGQTDPQALNMLSVFKHDVKEEDIREALKRALETPAESVDISEKDDQSVSWNDYIVKFPQLIQGLVESGYDESVGKAALQSYLPNSAITEQMLMEFALDYADEEEKIEELSKLYDEQREAFLQKSMKFKNRNRDVDPSTFQSLAKDEVATSFESLPSIHAKVHLLWNAYRSKLTGLVSDKYISLDVFGEMLKYLTSPETAVIERNLPVGLEAGKPCLVTCKEEQMLPSLLSVYTHSKGAPLPTYDEVLVCTPETEEEDIELIVRRALSPDPRHKKIYCLLGAEKLVYKVSKNLESLFFHFAQSCSNADYRFLIFCDAKAHNSYVMTAFDTYKVSFSCDLGVEIQKYLKTHLRVPSGVAPVAQVFEKPFQQNVKFVFSERAGMGKSLFVANTTRKAKTRPENAELRHKTIRLTESEIDFGFLLEELRSLEQKPTEAGPRIFHIDVSPVMTSEMEKGFLGLLPAVKCMSPVEVLEMLKNNSSGDAAEVEQQLLDSDTFRGDAFQRSYQYISRYQRKADLDRFCFTPGRVEGTQEECLRLLLDSCGRKNPSWTELSNFTRFLNLQLMKCENSVFCSSELVEEGFKGFKAFVIKFMITMSKDFALPSLAMADESSPSEEEKMDEDSVLRGYQLRRKWEQESHPYIIFHADNHSMEFLGFHINSSFDAVDAHSQAVLEKKVIDRHLYRTLEFQKVPFNKKFEDLSRQEQLETLCSVFGVRSSQDPDESYQLTLDNTMKMLAIHLRFQCGIPVIVMGETGCGKTKLVQFMCSLQRAGKDVQNMMLVRVHGGTSSKIIHQKVKEAIELARVNEETYCIVDERRKPGTTGPSHIVIITKVPRILGGCSYLAFSAGEWRTVHLDDLLPPETFAANLGQLSKMTVAEIFMNSTQQRTDTSCPEDSVAPEDAEKANDSPEENLQLINTEFLIKQSVQKAVIQLEDKKDNSQRATKRIQILYDALFQSQSKNIFASHFMEVLKRRICNLLQEQEMVSHKPREWIFRRALSSEFILEGTSFRHVVWIHLEDILANMFAQILAVVDANNNLDHISQETPISDLWLQMFKDESFLKIKYTSKAPDAKISVLSMSEDPSRSTQCCFPFSWVLKARLDEIWEKVHRVKGYPKDPTVDSAEMFQSSILNMPVPDGNSPEMVQRYASDFVRMAFPGQDVQVYEILSNVLITGAKQLCTSLTQDEVGFSLIWLHIEYFYLQENYQLFINLVKNEETLANELQKVYKEDTTKMFVALDAVSIVLKQLQPTEKALLPFNACLSWLKRIKSIKHTVELITLDDYQMRLYDNKEELLNSVLHQWNCTNIVYLLIDHLLHDETNVDEKLLKLVVKQFVFLWNLLYKTEDRKPAKIFEVVTKVLKRCSNNAATVYLVKGVNECKSCQNEITDPAELPCGHIFCTQCIREWNIRQCKICKESVPEDYVPTASQITREAVASHNKFRRKCNSFFVEFVSSYCFGDKIPPSAEIIEQLIKFVACKPSNSEHPEVRKVYKPTSDLSPFEECMDPSPTVKSSLLKMLLRCRLDDVKEHLEGYLSRMEEVLSLNQSSRNDFYFMVVCCFEDFMYSSFEEDASQNSEHVLSTADLSAPSSATVTSIENLQFIAKLRLAIGNVAAVLGRELPSAADQNTWTSAETAEKQSQLVNSMKNLVEKAQTPWPQIFLIRNLCNFYGLNIMQKILQQESWILPRGIETSQDMKISSNTPLMLVTLDRARGLIKNTDSEEAKQLTAITKHMERLLQASRPSEESMENKLEKIMSDVSSQENAALLEVVLHTALTLTLSQHPLTELFKSICFQPSAVKVSLKQRAIVFLLGPSSSVCH
ncbi:E3 ubiquitin-protein ligase rnf213-alpha-like [Trachemys scripta elegans]|uniref:E3 ubiquitin-protein ligase rnf213-alpha-like n=1 Tax=Trachemys scripta elegans TaxID=31138 RepID=UPI001556A6B0|nr:E3 ubiquitin-protein ligase rnf213-alpha-like [Trachemys scripta elegans]